MDTILYFSTSSTRGGAHMIYVGAQAEATRLGVHLQFVDCKPTPELVRDLDRLWHPAGAIACCGGLWNDLDEPIFGSMSVVLIDFDPSRMFGSAFSVLHDSAMTGCLAAKELLSTGVRNFAFVSQSRELHWSETREKSFERTVRMHGAEFWAMTQSGNWRGSAEWGRNLRAFLRDLPRPCALFASCDMVGVEVLAAARELGLEVPGQLAVLGVDDNEDLCENAVPTLSSIVPDYRRAGAMAVQGVLEMENRRRAETDGDPCVGSPPAPPRQVLYGDLGVVRRASTRHLASHDAIAAKALGLIRREALSGLHPARVAALFPCSRRMADKRFRKAVGHSIGAEIHAVQLSEMQRLLADPGRQLKAIADICGFGSPDSMRNFFRRETGMSPGAWRRRRAKRST